ncbi:NlpC/P60 family protein [Dehalobacter sp. DCM]|uniref:NlpC/P60 family protein n=1 Tax=Dehalobacter sp. DCM TaxID=2907827 RepID=UPI0030821FB7|nr:NlpC/P60 family protein [Dehalobacter sp. DCM]
MRFKQFVQVCLSKVRNSWKSPRIIGGLFISLLFIGSFAFYLAKPIHVVAVTVNGQKIGFVSDQNTGNDLIKKAASGSYIVTYDDVTVNNAEYLQNSLKKNNLETKLNQSYAAYELEIDGSVVAVVLSAADIDTILQRYENYFNAPSATNVVTETTIKEAVTSNLTTVSLDRIQSPEQVLNDLIDKKTLTIICKGTETTEEAIPYSTITKKDYTLAYAQKKVITQGSKGLKSVTTSYEQQNGKIIKQQVISEKIVKKAVDEVIAVGPSARALTVASSASISGRSYSDVVDYALSYVGSPYVFGGSSPKGFDCSGFVMYVYKAAGVNLPHSSFAQFASGTSVAKSDLQPGDLVFFSTYSSGASHVGIYVGSGKFVHAYNYSYGVTVSSLSSLSSRYLGARRY